MATVTKVRDPDWFSVTQGRAYALLPAFNTPPLQLVELAINRTIWRDNIVRALERGVLLDPERITPLDPWTDRLLLKVENSLKTVISEFEFVKNLLHELGTPISFFDHSMRDIAFYDRCFRGSLYIARYKMFSDVVKNRIVAINHLMGEMHILESNFYYSEDELKYCKYFREAEGSSWRLISKSDDGFLLLPRFFGFVLNTLNDVWKCSENLHSILKDRTILKTPLLSDCVFIIHEYACGVFPVYRTPPDKDGEPMRSPSGELVKRWVYDHDYRS